MALGSAMGMGQLIWFILTLVIDRTMALSETCRTELFGHSLSETTELNRTELSKFDWTFLIFFSHYDSQYEKK